ncbi:hypothetical protein E2C01_037041 [Portunus trituberculatus]|uniref:Uncharacterized protein n=1 Tax=Portunus trituberculatus TaxID=210409 RepID=A0A5B7FD24_PORTR|nr:hypothetical protein [Portunus trituberculatus]
MALAAAPSLLVLLLLLLLLLLAAFPSLSAADEQAARPVLFLHQDAHTNDSATVNPLPRHNFATALPKTRKNRSLAAPDVLVITPTLGVHQQSHAYLKHSLHIHVLRRI